MIKTFKNVLQINNKYNIYTSTINIRNYTSSTPSTSSTIWQRSNNDRKTNVNKVPHKRTKIYLNQPLNLEKQKKQEERLQNIKDNNDSNEENVQEQEQEVDEKDLFRLKNQTDPHMIDLDNFYNENKVEIDGILSKSDSKKTPMALCFGYDGTGYYGLSYSKQLEFPAIENTIEKALFKLGYILPSNVGDPGRIKLSRSSRTDKGVHSLATVISCFLLMNEHDSAHLDGGSVNKSTFINNVNSNLPPGIRLFSATRVQRKFKARRKGTQRTYHYMLPESFFTDQKVDINKINRILSRYIGVNSFHNYTGSRNTYVDISESNYYKNIIKNTPQPQQQQQQEQHEDDDGDDDKIKNYYDQEEEVEEVKKPGYVPNRLVEKLSFRNNSVNMRNIKQFYIEKEMVSVGDSNWYRFVIVGESFITFQIRKMMGFVLSVIKGHQSIDGLEISIRSPFSVQVPTAPPFSLYLYDVEFEKSKTEHSVTNLFNSETNAKQKQFLNQILIPRFAQIETETNQFKLFSDYLAIHNYQLDDIDQLLILNEQYHSEKVSRVENFRKSNEVILPTNNK